jgi:hypothetical protein
MAKNIAIIASMTGANDPGRSRIVMSSTTAGTRLRTCARHLCASVWPICMHRKAADVVNASRPYANAIPVSCMCPC